MDSCVTFLCEFLGPSVPLKERQNDTRKVHSKIHNSVPAKAKEGIVKTTLREEGPDYAVLQQVALNLDSQLLSTKAA